MFSTTRLILRGIKATDNDSISALFNDKLVVPCILEGYVVPRSFSSMDITNAFLNSMLMCCVIEELETGEFVGLAGFHKMETPKNRNAVIFISLTPKHWRKGYGFETMNFLIDYAFEELGMHRVSLSVFEGNNRALALYRKLGFVEEGRHRKSIWMNGLWHDNIDMGILDDEWTERRKEGSRVVPELKA